MALCCGEWMQMGPARSGLSFAIDRMPEKEQKIVFVRMREFEANMTVTLEEIKKLAERARARGRGEAVMRTSTTIEASGGDWREIVDYVTEAEKLGLDICWVAEAWGSEAPSPLGYLAAKTERMLLGSGIIQLGTRTPMAIARAAITLSQISQGRFLLGLGPSGPQVIEGLHGVPFARPLSRMRETVEIVRRGRLGRKSLLLRAGVPDPTAGRGGEAHASVDACRARHSGLPGHPLAEDAAPDR